MSLPIVLLTEAEADIEEIISYYDDQELGLGDDFKDELDRAFERIGLMPNSFPILQGNARFCRIRRFPYLVYYRVKSKYVEVFAVLDGRRNEFFWQRRL